jgi:hypothetical protein
MGFYDPAARSGAIVTTAEADPLAGLLPERHAAWRTLDVAVLHDLIIDRVLLPRFGGDAVGFKYTADAGDAKAMAEAQPGRLLVLVQPTPLASVRSVSEAGELMPPKSTYFYPKLATGLAINPLD